MLNKLSNFGCFIEGPVTLETNGNLETFFKNNNTESI